jgi:hypothetical protein
MHTLNHGTKHAASKQQNPLYLYMTAHTHTRMRSRAFRQLQSPAMYAVTLRRMPTLGRPKPTYHSCPPHSLQPTAILLFRTHSLAFTPQRSDTPAAFNFDHTAVTTLTDSKCTRGGNSPRLAGPDLSDLDILLQQQLGSPASLIAILMNIE